MNFGDSVRLVGSRIDRVPGTPAGAIDVTLTWEALRSPLPDCIVHLALQDAEGRVVARRDKAPLFGLRPCSRWRAGEVVRDHQRIRLPPGATAGRYRLTLELTLDGRQVAPEVDDSVVPGARRDRQSTPEDPAFARLGLVDVPAPPPSATLPGSFPIGATIGDVFSLDAARVEAVPTAESTAAKATDRRYVARIAPGDSLRTDLLLRSLADAPVDYAVFVHLLDARQGLVAQRDNFPDHENLPTTVWFPGDTLIDGYRLDTSRQLRPGVYVIGMGMYTRHDLTTLPVRGARSEGYQVVLGRVKVTSRDHEYGHPERVAPIDAVFGSEIALVGGSVQSRAHSQPGSIVVDLAWRARVQPTADYTVFVHVLDSQGRLVAQHDGQPQAGAYPTSDWDAGDTVYDTISVALPPTLTTGTYHVAAGLYELAAGTRLSLPNGATSVQIGTLEVE